MLFVGSFWEKTYFGNSLADYGEAVFVFAGLWVAFFLLQRVALKVADGLAKKSRTDLDDAVVEMVRRVKPPLYLLIAFYIAMRQVAVSGLPEMIVRIILISWVTYEVIQGAQHVIDYVVRRKLVNEDDRSTEVVMSLVRGLSRILLWTLGILFILQNLGVNVTSLIAGLGIGGIAVALAAQNILGDLFSSLAIYLDRPFKPGDFIEIGSQKGTVERVGIKTTRIRAIDGEEVVIPNQDITSSRISNIKRREKRRVLFTLGLLYDTPTSKMRDLPAKLQEIVNGVSGTDFSRAHFVSFDDSALTFEVVYTMESTDIMDYFNAHHEILLKIKDLFEREGLGMAYPTQTIFLEKGEA